MNVVSFPPGTETADELAAAVAEAQAALAAAGETVAMRRDPLRLILAGLSSMLDALLKTTRRWERATAAVVEARQPFPQAERDKLVRDVTEASRDAVRKGVRAEAGAMIRSFDRKVAIAVGLSVAGAFLGGALLVLCVQWATSVGPFSRDAQAGAAWREIETNNPDPRPALAGASVRTDARTGRRYAGVSLWIDPPGAAPAVGRQP